MKLSVIAPVLSVFVLAACGNPPAAGPAATIGGKDNTAIDHHHPATEAAEGKPGLNKGKKWKSDASTLGYVQALQSAADSTAALTKPTTGDYQQAAGRLQDIADSLISNCRMSGPDHAALHQWLEPLLEKIKALKQAGPQGDAARNLADIRGQLKQFTDYFEF